ncbi:MAG: energy-coupling factor transporter transmembrane protein EcfT [Oscillospiraceae bacterium]|jgi:energy-coupling factor transport system permease protein|nr:energy-coupling factor transporter transmembrane protein EcfT [Oscillospiraceae bacterium]
MPVLKDITLGQYFPGTSVVHRLDPRVKIILVVSYIAALFLAKGLYGYALSLCYLALAAAVSGIKPIQLVRGLRPMLFIVIFTAVLNILYIPGEHELFTVFSLSVTLEGVTTAIYMIMRLFMLVTCTFLLTYTTSPIMLTAAIEKLLAPFKLLRLPVHELAMMMTIALRMVPTLIEETDKIMSAQKARGADFESGNILKRAKALVPLLVPLFVSSFRRADELAVAMECRCYHGGAGRTKMKQLRVTAPDFAVAVPSLLYFAGCVTVGRLL